MVSKAELEKHNTPESLWVLIEGNVYDLTEWQNTHPGGKKILARFAGKDATKQFRTYHDVKKVLGQYGDKYRVGPLDDANATACDDAAVALNATSEEYKLHTGDRVEVSGDMIPYADPMWEQGFYSPYYGEAHNALRAEVRAWVDEHVQPFVDEWDERGEIPAELYHKFGQAGFLSYATSLTHFPAKWVRHHPKSVTQADYDSFLGAVIVDELGRAGSGGVLWNLVGGYGIGLPPIANFARPEVQDRVLPPIIAGEQRVCLCITEPEAGSDVANLTTTAEKTADGKHYIVNGTKKFITNGIMANYFSVAVRTGKPGMGGISMLLIEDTFPGISRRSMKMQGMHGSGTTFITFEDVKVPVENLLGKENAGFKVIVTNFNHERMGIIQQALRLSRVCYEEACKYAHERETFGKKLIQHDVIRNKLAQMAGKIEAIQAWSDYLIYQDLVLGDQEAMFRLGGAIAGAKAQSTMMMEYCAREASQIFGGHSYTRGGKASKVERIYREVRAYAIPGGSEEIMLDLSMRQALRVHQALGAKL